MWEWYEVLQKSLEGMPHAETWGQERLFNWEVEAKVRKNS